MNFGCNFFSSTIFWTILSGTSVFVLGQIIQIFVLEKIYKYKEIVAKIDNRTKYYFKEIESPGTDAHPSQYLKFCSQELLQLSCDLESSYKQLIFRNGTKDRKITKVSELLIKLHYGVFGKGDNQPSINQKDISEIRSLLGITRL